jgi:hypothetical protein
MMNAKTVNESNRLLFNEGGRLDAVLCGLPEPEDTTPCDMTPFKVLAPDEIVTNVMRALGGLLNDRHVKINEARTVFEQLWTAWEDCRKWYDGEDVPSINCYDPEIPF